MKDIALAVPANWTVRQRITEADHELRAEYQRGASLYHPRRDKSFVVLNLLHLYEKFIGVLPIGCQRDVYVALTRESERNPDIYLVQADELSL